MSNDNKVVMEKTCPEYKIADILDCKTIGNIKSLLNEKRKINTLNVDKIKKTSFAGNPIVYHYFFEELLHTKKNNKYSFYDIWNDEEKRQELIKQTIKRDRRKKEKIIHPEDLYECWRINNGAITFFKPSVMKQLLFTLFPNLNNSEGFPPQSKIKILDLSMGWGGRLIGAMAIGHSQVNIEYVGYDTNKSLKIPYEALINQIYPNKGANIHLHFKDFINVNDDYEDETFDCMISSPPYNNLEVYSHMNPFHSKNEYYEWLNTYIMSATLKVKKGGYVAISLSKQIYDEMVKRRPDLKCSWIELMGQQMGKSNKKDYIYVWEM